jgi:hypothetical protein
LHSGETEHEAVLVSIYADWRLVLRQLWRRHRPAASSSRHDDRRTSLFGSASSGESRINGGAEMDYWIAIARVIAKATAHRPRVLSLISALTAALPWFMPGVAWSDDLSSAPARTPFGVYAHIDFESMLPEMVKRFPSIQISQTATQSCAVVATSPNDLAALHIALQNFYTTLLSDGAVSGITMGMHWCRMQVQEPNKANSVCSVVSGEQPCYPDGNDWSYLDDLFTAVHEYNATNEAAKTIQLIVTPGVYSPSWLTDGSILKSCDPLFEGTMSIPDCGMVTFNLYPEQRNALDPPEALLILPMPLPWNSQYLDYWGGFVEDLAARYGADRALVAVVIAGPTCATTEMILPTEANNSSQQSGLDADDAWLKLITNSFPNNKTYATYPAQVFVDSWELTIRGFEQIFANANLTLILTPDDYKSMPEFAGTTLPLTNELKEDFINFHNDDCYDAQFKNPPLPLSCQTKATIAFYFLTYAAPQPIGGKIARGTSVGGMTASSYQATGEVDLPGVKLLAAPRSPFTPSGAPVPGGPLLGGAEFDFALTRFNLSDNSYNPSTYPPTFPVGDHFQEEACLHPQGQQCSNDSSNTTSVEQGAFQVFANFFNGTEAAYLFNAAAYTQIDGAGAPPTQFRAPIQYVDVDWQDVMYAIYTAGNCALAGTTLSTQFLGPTLMQDVLNQAKFGLEVIAHARNAQRPQLACA